MRDIFKYISEFYKQSPKGYMLSVMLFTGILIFAEYNFNITRNLLAPNRFSAVYFWGHCIVYALPLLFGILSYAYFYKNFSLLLNKKFWLAVTFIIVSYSFRAYFYQHREWAIQLNNGEYNAFLVKSANQFFQAFLVFAPVIVYWLISGHYKHTALYGFRIKNVNLKPYFGLLALMLPLVAIASTQNDFLQQYPMAKGILQGNEAGIFTYFKIISYEILYGIDFIATELFFRGFIIYILAKYMGPGAIITMAAMYVSIHFGKPLGETISSFFGGTILGIIAYRTNSIAGGVIVHCGIAWLMEIGGFWGNALN